MRERQHKKCFYLLNYYLCPAYFPYGPPTKATINTLRFSPGGAMVFSFTIHWDSIRSPCGAVQATLVCKTMIISEVIGWIWKCVTKCVSRECFLIVLLRMCDDAVPSFSNINFIAVCTFDGMKKTSVLSSVMVSVLKVTVCTYLFLMSECCLK